MADKQQFPRGKNLPKQSPLFWVQQKDRYLRQLLISDIEEISGRRLVCYFANSYLSGSGIDSGDIAYLQELLGDLNGAPTDLLLNTNGGFTDATEAVISLIQTLAPDLRVVVPHSAKSNGTTISLAARELVMGPPSQLGPIDPYVDGVPASILVEEVVRQNNFVLFSLATYAIMQSKSLAERLLSQGMMNDKDATQVKETVNALASRDKYASHGAAIDHREAALLGLKVKFLENDDPLWQRIWLLYCMYSDDCTRNNLLKIFEGNSRSLSVANS